MSVIDNGITPRRNLRTAISPRFAINSTRSFSILDIGSKYFQRNYLIQHSHEHATSMKLVVGGNAVAYHDPTLSVLSAIPLSRRYPTSTRWSEGVVIGDSAYTTPAEVSPSLKTSPRSFERRGRLR
jgi:hypothetical protein